MHDKPKERLHGMLCSHWLDKMRAWESWKRPGNLFLKKGTHPELIVRQCPLKFCATDDIVFVLLSLEFIEGVSQFSVKGDKESKLKCKYNDI